MISRFVMLAGISSPDEEKWEGLTIKFHPHRRNERTRTIKLATSTEGSREII